MMRLLKRWRWTTFLLVFTMLFIVACGGSDTPEPTEAPASSESEEPAEEPAAEPTEAPAEEPEEEPEAMGEPVTLSMWYHGGGNSVERDTIIQIIEDFNASQSEYIVEFQDFPQESYNESIVAAALAGDLPDIIDVDGPVMPNWAWAGYMQPLDLPTGTVDDFLPGALGYWDGELYSVGLWDAAIAVYARQSELEANGIRIPTLDNPWSLEEFDAALETLQATGNYEYALDPGMAWTGEWYPYAFSPLMQSFGGDIIDRSTYTTAEGAINGDEAIAFGEWWQSLFERGLAPGTSQDGADRDTGFIDGKYALQWNGNWAGVATLDGVDNPDDVLFLPAPDFGNGNRIGSASWQFGISASSEHPAGANAFIAFAAQDEYLAAFSDGIGLIPATASAATMTENYAPGGPLEIFFELSNQQGTLRPPTPAYLSAALTFEKALADIANGADVLDALDAAADEINADLEANDNYGFDGSVVGPDIQNDAIATGAMMDSGGGEAMEAGDAAMVSLWYHGAGNETERSILQTIIDDYNSSQNACMIEIQEFPQESYNESIVAAALAGDLPDIIDVDGPVMPNWAWAGYMQPLNLPAGTVDDFLPGALGYWDGELYSVGLWDAAIAVYARESELEANGIRIPTLDNPWSLEEFDAALETLQATGNYEHAFDPGMAWTGEWYPYAFSPLMQSFGGDIIDRSTYTTAEGVINGDEAIAFGEWWQSLFERGLAPGTSQDGADRETGFIDGKYALQWNGNWAGVATLDGVDDPDDILFLPAPDFGNGNRIGAASWQFGVSADSEHPDCANGFIAHATQDEYLAAFSDGIGLIPATASAATMTENYAAGGPLEIFFELSSQQGTLRPPTPAYLSAALTFEKALADIANGADVIDALDAAADEINADIEANSGYGFDGSVVGPDIQNDAIATGEMTSSSGGGGEMADLSGTASLWYHGAGNEVERAILQTIIEDFNSVNACTVEIQEFPQESYNESIVAAALAGDLPDIIDVDGPVMPNWAWAGYMQPLNLPAGTVDDFLPGALGYWDGQLYSVGLWDAAIAVYARESELEANGIRIPTLDDPWTLEEFDGALEALQATGNYEHAFDPGMAWTGEWYPYAFSPLMQSFGGDIIDRSTFTTAEGVINGDEAIAFGEWWQSLFERGLAPGTSQDGADRETGFIDGKYALQWNGNWAGVATLDGVDDPDDILFLPAPDFGNGNRIGAASWQFGVSAGSQNPDCANAFIAHAAQDEYLAAFSDGIGLIPATASAAAMSENYAAGGPLEIFFELSSQQGTLRPPTPAYLSAALTFEKALADIANGADVIDALDAAADEINADIEANSGYGFDGSEVGPDIQNDEIAP